MTENRKQTEGNRRRKKKRSRLRFTLILLLVLAALLLAGGGVFYMIRSSRAAAALPFQLNRQFGDSSYTAMDSRLDGIAKDLCVVEEDVELQNVELEYGQSAVLFDLSAKKVLFSQNAYERIYPASLTKIMTALVVMRYANLSDTVIITPADLSLEEGSQVCGFEVGDVLTVDQLLRSLLVYSGNDAAQALANHVGGSVEDFVALMNAYAQELGMTGTQFSNPHGLHAETHYTTIYDIYLMLQEAYGYSQFTEITSLPYYDVIYKNAAGEDASIHMNSTDYYLCGEATPPRNVTILGGKTGFTDQAGNCLALITQNGEGNPFISIVLGASEKPVLYSEMSALLQNINGQ